MRVRCKQCGATLKVSAQMAGRKVRCPQCQARYVLPQNLADKSGQGSAGKGGRGLAGDDARAGGGSASGGNESSVRTARDGSGLVPSEAVDGGVRTAGDNTESFGVAPMAAEVAAQRNPRSGGGMGVPPGAHEAIPRIGDGTGSASGDGDVDDAAARAAFARNRVKVQRAAMAGFGASMRRVRTPFGYRFGVLFALVVLLVMPAVYVALVGLVGYAVYWHMTANTWLLTVVRGRAAIFVFLVYVSPLVIGPILVLFMIKPLFSRESYEGRTRRLTPEGEPVLFAFVERLCEIMGAPKPAKIYVDAQVNASAGLERGIFSRELVLTIGVPLTAGLRVDEFAGVLAHEFGHFTQGGAMRVTALVRQINGWFARVVYERDAWDVWLDEVGEEMDFRIAWIFAFAKLGVMLSRGVLWVLMMVGHGVASFALRQMERHADLHEIRVVGSRRTESIKRSLAVLHPIQQLVMELVVRQAEVGRLPDNLPWMVWKSAKQVPQDFLAKVNQAIEETGTGWFDSHPSSRDRIARARKLEEAGVYACAGSAAMLFSNFDTLARNVTWDFYRHVFGSGFQPSDMTSTAEVVRVTSGSG